MPEPQEQPKQPESYSWISPEQFFGAATPDYPSMAREAATRYGVDPNIFERQISHESVNYDADVISGRRKSPKGATGIAQFMPDTAARYGLRGADLADPPKALDAAARHMRDLLDETGNDYEAALAGYNAGIGRVRDSSWRNIPETRNYTRAILGAASSKSYKWVAPDSFFGSLGQPAETTTGGGATVEQPSARSKYSTWTPPATAASVAATVAPTPAPPLSARSKYSMPPARLTDLFPQPADITKLPEVTSTPQPQSRSRFTSRVDVSAGAPMGEDDLYREWYNARASGQLPAADLVAKNYLEQFPQGKYSKYLNQPVTPRAIADQQGERGGAGARVPVAMIEQMRRERVPDDKILKAVQDEAARQTGLSDRDIEVLTERYGQHPFANIVEPGTDSRSSVDSILKQGRSNAGLAEFRIAPETIQAVMRDRTLLDPGAAQAEEAASRIGSTGAKEFLETLARNGAVNQQNPELALAARYLANSPGALRLLSDITSGGLEHASGVAQTASNIGEVVTHPGRLGEIASDFFSGGHAKTTPVPRSELADRLAEEAANIARSRGDVPSSEAVRSGTKLLLDLLPMMLGAEVGGPAALAGYGAAERAHEGGRAAVTNAGLLAGPFAVLSKSPLGGYVRDAISGRLAPTVEMAERALAAGTKQEAIDEAARLLTRRLMGEVAGLTGQAATNAGQFLATSAAITAASEGRPMSGKELVHQALLLAALEALPAIRAAGEVPGRVRSARGAATSAVTEESLRTAKNVSPDYLSIGRRLPTGEAEPGAQPPGTPIGEPGAPQSIIQTPLKEHVHPEVVRSEVAREIEAQGTPALWHAAEGDIPVSVIGDLGAGADGRRYVKVAGYEGGIPVDELGAAQPAANPQFAGRVSSEASRATVPEAPDTLHAQLEALRRARTDREVMFGPELEETTTRKAVLVTPGEQMPASKGALESEGFAVTRTKAGTFIHDPREVSRQEVRQKATDGSFHELLGIVEAKSQATTEAVVARHPETGVELQAAMASPENVPAQSDSLKSQFPESVISVERPENVIAGRQAARTTEAAGQGTGRATPAQQAEAAQRAAEYRKRGRYGEGPPAEAAVSPDVERSGLVPGTRALVETLKQRLASGEGVKDNPALTRLADEAFSGTRAKGTYGPKDSADALEVAVNEHLKERAPGLMNHAKPKEALAEIRQVLKLLPRQADRTTEQIELQQFSTPPTEAFVAAKALAPRPDDVLLEPSAGTGSLAMWGRAIGAEVHTNEIDPRRRALLQEQGYEPTSVDAQFLNDLLPAEIQPTAVLMNPPFSATGGRVERHDAKYGAEHVEDALKRLAPNGRLVAIVSEGMKMSAPKMRRFWERILGEYNVRANIAVPGEEYGKYGTTYGNQIVVIDKTGPTPGDTTYEQLSRVIMGSPENLEGVLDALKPVISDRPVVEAPARVGSPVQRPDRRPGRSEPARAAERGDEHLGTRERPRPPVEQARPARPSEGPRAVSANEPRPKPVEAAKPETLRPGVADNLDVRSGVEPAAELSVSEQIHEQVEEGDTFVAYRPAKLKAGKAHPGQIVESASMAGVQPPDITYRPKLDPKILSEGVLSNLQYEAVSYAGQRHEQRLPNGNRAAFFIGDGTGVGKGRELAAIALDNWNQGRKRILWLSVNNDLLPSAERDLKALGGQVPLAVISDYPASGSIDFAKGVLFSSYPTLISKSKNGRERIDQIREWLGPDGVILFDEAHLAKNAVTSGQKESSQRGQKVVDLQEGDKTSPDYRVVYSSATGATDVDNMGYMARLGLWGPGTSFATFKDFATAIDQGGVGAMEMVSRDMKAMGMYAARTLSYKGVDYREVEHKLGDAQRALYDTAARAWQTVLQNFDQAITVTNGGKRARSQAMKRFWNDEQRFFRQFLTALKVPAAIEEIEAALKKGHSVVLGLYGTGEARTKDQVTSAMAAGRDLDDLDFSPKQILTHLVDAAFPTQRYTEANDPVTGNLIKVPVTDADGNPVESAEAKRMKQALLDELEKLALPDNPLDQIVNYFGADHVAEITGRKKRLVRGADGRTRYVKRVEGVSIEKASQHEMEAFQDARKRIAIISASASTGISLHADNTAKNTQRRVHITLETGWSADVQMQTFGRTHRTDQASAPEYVLLATDVGGERRFLSTIAKRLASLGALTKGERKATGVGATEKEGLEKYDFLNQYGVTAIRRMIDQPRKVIADQTAMKMLDKIGLVKETERGKKIQEPTVEQFLNRVLALEVGEQNAMFGWFGDEFAHAVQNAKDQGTFDEGVTDIKGESIRLVGEPAVVATDKTTGAETLHYQLEVDHKTHPLSLADARAELKAKADEGAAFYKQDRSGRVILATKAASVTDERTGSVTRRWHVHRPSGAHSQIITQNDLTGKYQVLPSDEAAPLWNAELRTVPKVRTETMHLIGGAILPVWERIAAKAQGVNTVRVVTDDGQRILGAYLPPKSVGPVLREIGVERSFKSPEAIFSGVLDDGETVNLVGGLRLEQVRFKGDDAIELVGASSSKAGELKKMGLLHEIISYRDRFFVPTNERVGVGVLTKLLERYPATEAGPSEARASLRDQLNQVKAEERQAGEAGFLTIREGRGGAATQGPAGEGFRFENDESEQRWRASHGMPDTSFRMKLREWGEELKNKATREYEHLPRKAEHAEFRFALKRIEQGKGIWSDEAVRILQGLTAKLNKTTRDLFERRVIFDDLLEEVERQADALDREAARTRKRVDLDEDIRIPFGFTPASLLADSRRLDEALKNYPEVTDAVEQRRSVVREITSGYLKAAKEAIGFEPRLDRQSYYRHQVLAYAQASRRVLGTGHKLQAPTARGYLKRRRGSELDINTDYLQAEHSVVAQMLYDTEIFKLIHLVDENYNVSEQLRAEAKRANANAIQEIIDDEDSRGLNKPRPKQKRLSLSQFVRARGGIREDSDLSGERRRLSPKESGTTGLTSARRDRGLSPDLMREAAVEAGYFTEDDRAAQNAGDFLSAVEQDAGGGRKIYSMQDDVPDFERPMFLTVSEQMRLFKQRIGRGFAEMRGLAAEGELWAGDDNEWERAVGRLRATRNYDEDLSEKNALFKYLAALAGNENAAGNLQARIILKAISERREFVKKTLGDKFQTWDQLVPEGYRLWQPREGNVFYQTYTLPERMLNRALETMFEEIGVMGGDLRRRLSMGGRRREFAIPERVAKTLDEFMKPRSDNILDRGVRLLIQKWKVLKLLAPGHVIRYNTRNLSGDADAPFVGNPRTFLRVPQAIGDLWTYLVRKGAPSEDLQMWLERGGLHNLFQVAEDVGAVNGLKVFRRLEVDKEAGIRKIAPWKVWKHYWRLVRMGTDFREAILRYASFVDYRDQMLERRGKPKNYGASIPEEVNAMRNIDDKAFKLSNDLLGAYDEVTVLGDWIRTHVWPFWSFQEVNAKRYYRFFKNAIHEGTTASEVGRNIVGKAIRLSPVMAYRIGKFVLKAVALWAMLEAFNKTVFPDEEKDLDPEIRARAHIVLGRNADGTVRYFDRLGMLTDFLSWFGLDEAPHYVTQWLDNKKGLKEIALDMAKAPVNKFWQGIGPAKTLAEIATGRNTYPDVFRSRNIRDRWQPFFDTFELGGAYAAISHKPSRGVGRNLRSLFLYEVAPDESAYNQIMGLKSDFNRAHGKAADVAAGNDKSNAAYYLKLALRYGDVEGARYWLAEFRELDGTAQGLQESLKSLSPLAGLNDSDKAAFLKTLTADEREKLVKAQMFFDSVLDRSGEVGPADLLARPIAKEIREPVDKELHRLGVTFPYPQNEVTLGNARQKMPKATFDEFQQRIADSFYEQLGDLISRPIYQRWNDADKKLAIEDFKQAWSSNEHKGLHSRLVLKSGATGLERIDAQMEGLDARKREAELRNKDLFFLDRRIERKLHPRSALQIDNDKP